MAKGNRPPPLQRLSATLRLEVQDDCATIIRVSPATILASRHTVIVEEQTRCRLTTSRSRAKISELGRVGRISRSGPETQT